MRLPCLDKMPDSFRNPQMIIPDHREPFLPPPNQVTYILRRPRYHVVRGCHTCNHGRREPNENITVSAEYRTRHGSHQHVDAAREELLVAFLGRAERGYGGGEAVFGVHETVHATVYGVFGFDGVAMGEEPRLPDLIR